MNFFKTLSEQLQNLWTQWTTGQRILIGGGTIACLLAVGSVFYWATQPEFVVLRTQLTPKQTAEIVGLLENEGIESTMNFSGTSVSVPRGKFAAASMAIGEVVDSSYPLAAEERSSWGSDTPSQENERRTRKLEASIAHSIQKIRGIRSATVHISQSSHSPFIDDQKPTTASLLVELGPNGTLSTQTAQSIVLISAKAVEGLLPEQITLTDTSGRTYSINDVMQSGMQGQVEFQQLIELGTAAKAETLLTTILGPGKASVTVNALIDFRESKRITVEHDTSGKARTFEHTSTTNSTEANPEAIGDPGLASNSGTGGSFLEGISKPKVMKTEDNEYQYIPDRFEETTMDRPGTVTRLTVSAGVELPEDATATGGTLAERQAEIENLIKTAVGFDEERGDAITVSFGPLVAYADLDTEIAVPPIWEQYAGLIQSASLGLASLVALILGMMVIKRLKPVVVTATPEGQLSADELTSLAQLSQQKLKKQGITAGILNTWLGGRETANAEQKAA